MNIWKDIEKNKITPEEFIACIEIPKGSKMKYELDKSTGKLILDRVLYTSTHYPQNYGFIPRTYADDYDPLDVLVMCQEPIVPLCLVRCYPIGVVKMVDSDQNDEKIIAPMGLVMLALPVVIADVNVNRFNEDWQYDFANMKLPDQYVWVFFGSWATALVCNLVKSIPMWAMAVCWNMALAMTVLYMVVGVSILVAFARRRTAAITAGRIVFTVVLLCFIPFVNAVVMIGLPILGVLETWIAFRSEN